MRARNTLISLWPILAAAAVTMLVGAGLSGDLVSFFVVLDVVISFFMMALFVDYWRLGRAYERSILKLAKEPSPRSGYRVAVVIPIFNEPPEMVVDTEVAAKMAVGNQGDVYVLDDSTDEQIKKSLTFTQRTSAFRCSGEKTGRATRRAPSTPG